MCSGRSYTGEEGRLLLTLLFLNAARLLLGGVPSNIISYMDPQHEDYHKFMTGYFIQRNYRRQGVTRINRSDNNDRRAERFVT